MVRLSSIRMYSIIFSCVVPLFYGIVAGKLAIQFTLMMRNTMRTKNSRISNSSNPIENPYGLINSSNGNLDPDSLSQSLWRQKSAASHFESPIVWIVTPTYCRKEQLADLTQTAEALYPARKFVRWLIYDEFETNCTKPEKNIQRIREHLSAFQISFVVTRTKPFVLKNASPRVKKNPKRWKGKGIMARRGGIEFLRKSGAPGVVYFADDDNTYDSDIFFQLNEVKKVGVFPVGAMYHFFVSTPIFDDNASFIDFHDAFLIGRKFPVDFAGFAINLSLIHQNKQVQLKDIQSYLETYLLVDLNVEKSDLQPLASNCTEILTWHTKTSERGLRGFSYFTDIVATPLRNIYENINQEFFTNIPKSFFTGTNIPVLQAKYKL